MNSITLAAEGELNPLIPHPVEIVLSLVVFALLYLAVKKWVVPNFEKTFAERTSAIEGGLQAAETKQAEADAKLAELEKQLRPQGPFACLIWDHRGGWSTLDRAALARGLLEAGCRYFVCAGLECDVWEESADEEYAQLLVERGHDVEESNLVVTTSHANEPPAEVARFFAFDARLSACPIQVYVVIHVGDGATNAVDDAVRDQATAQAAYEAPGQR